MPHGVADVLRLPGGPDHVGVSRPCGAGGRIEEGAVAHAVKRHHALAGADELLDGLLGVRPQRGPL